MKKLNYLAPLLIALVALGLQQAKADTFSFNLTNGNPAISGFSGPYATVSINLTDSTHATVTFTSLTNSGNIYLMGDGSTNALNVNASSFTVGTVTGTNNGGGTPGPFTVNMGSMNVDGFGSFNLTIDSFDGFGHSSDSTTFTLTNTSGSWANAAAVLSGNSFGWLAAAHIFVAMNGTTYVNLNSTGYAGGMGPSVPDGGTTVMLLGAALGALGMVRRFLRS